MVMHPGVSATRGLVNRSPMIIITSSSINSIVGFGALSFGIGNMRDMFTKLPLLDTN